MNREFESLLSMGVYEECDLHPGRKAISSESLLKIKRNQHGAVENYKVRLVACGNVDSMLLKFRQPQLKVRDEGDSHVIWSIQVLPLCYINWMYLRPFFTLN
jgi:hypothetical protein